MGYYEYLPPSYSDTGSGSPLLVALNGYGETGDGTAGRTPKTPVGRYPAVHRRRRMADRPAARCARLSTRRGAAWLRLSSVTVPTCSGGLVQYAGPQHDRNHAITGVLHDAGRGPQLHHLRLSRTTTSTPSGSMSPASPAARWARGSIGEYGDEQVAAAVPIAGEGRPAWSTAGCGLASVPLWAFHGELDDVVNPQGSIEPMTNLAACPGVTADRAQLTVYPGLFHEGWDQAYSGVPRRRHLQMDAFLQQTVTAPLAGQRRNLPSWKWSPVGALQVPIGQGRPVRCVRIG